MRKNSSNQISLTVCEPADKSRGKTRCEPLKRYIARSAKSTRGEVATFAQLGVYDSTGADHSRIAKIHRFGPVSSAVYERAVRARDFHNYRGGQGSTCSGSRRARLFLNAAVQKVGDFVSAEPL